jgi:hypothetical protein
MNLALIWAVFAILFVGLSLFHFFALRRSIAPFEAQEIEYRDDIDVEFATRRTDVDLNSSLRNLFKDFNWLH